MVQKTAFGLEIIPESLLPLLIQKGFHVGDFRKLKKFDQTPYKLPPPTPIHVLAEKRTLEENSLPKKRVRITPVMRRVSRRSELPMAPVQIPQPPVQFPQPPVKIPDIPDVLEPVQIPLVLEHVQIPLVPQSPVQIPVSHVLEPTGHIPHVPEPPVHIPVSQVPQSPVKIPPVLIPLVHVPDVPEHVQIPVSQVPQSPVKIPPVQIPPVLIPLVHVPDVPEHVQIPVSQVPQPPMQILPEPMQILPEPMQILPEPMQILPEPMQILPEHDTLDPLKSTDAFDQLMSFVFGPQELQLLHTVPSIFDGNLLSFLDEFERVPMDLTMPRLNSCVKKSIEFKAMDSHLDLTWDTGVDLKFFRVCRSPSRQVWEAPENTEAYPLDLPHCTRLADVTWLTWLDDWEMHRDNLHWRVP
ncbi:uncharacterized protein TNCV_3829251 [Trichonephila clavipes]|nr:uncharacterized protein TNCV_3829251 [Trichonephila clavipes]